MQILRRFFELPKQSFFLFGPRGTGKSTWLRAQLPDSLYLDLLDPALKRGLRARPERLRDHLAGSPSASTVVIDDYPEARAALLHRGEARLRIDGIWCLPAEEFLGRLVPGRGPLDWL